MQWLVEVIRPTKHLIDVDNVRSVPRKWLVESAVRVSVEISVEHPLGWQRGREEGENEARARVARP